MAASGMQSSPSSRAGPKRLFPRGSPKGAQHPRRNDSLSMPSISLNPPQSKKQILSMISQSLYGPWPALAEDDYHFTRLDRADATASSPIKHSLRANRAHPSSNDATLRIQCLRILHMEESLSAREAAPLLGVDPHQAHALFVELRHLGLLERSGLRCSSEETSTTFQLNLKHPLLELILAPSPRLSKSARKNPLPLPG